MAYQSRTCRRVVSSVACALSLFVTIAAADAQSDVLDVSNWHSKRAAPVESADVLKHEAESGKLEAQLRYAKYLFDHDEKSIAVLWLTEANNQGSIEAEYLLGQLYENGDGVAQDFEQSRYFFGKAADQGYAPAQYKLGKLLINSEFDDPQMDTTSDQELQKKITRGVTLLRKSANSGYAPSQYEMGLLALNGNMTEKNPREAFSYLKKAADQGVAAAAYMTATCYASGIGTAINTESAKQYLRKTIGLAGLESDYGRDAESKLKELGVSANH